jgi:hypothetical protein
MCPLRCEEVEGAGLSMNEASLACFESELLQLIP